MSTIRLIAPLLVAAACAPPPEPVGAPTIRIAYPPQENESGDGPFEIFVDEDGTFPVLVVVDTENVTLRSPYEEGVELVDGEGHWHLSTEAGTVTSFLDHAVYVPAATEVVADGILVLTVSLRQNNHDPVVVDGDPVQDTVEVRLVAP